MTSSVTPPFDSPWPLSYILPTVNDPLAPLVSEIFDLKFSDPATHPKTYKQNSTRSDNKARLKLSAREPLRSLKCLPGVKCEAYYRKTEYTNKLRI